MTSNEPSAAPVLYVVTCGTPAAQGVTAFVRHAQASGWRVCVVPTPMGANFIEADNLAEVTGYPVRTTYKHPSEPDILPPADAFAVAPATFNTVNKIAAGITDTLAAGLVCEGIGYGRPVIVAPWLNRPLACHSAYGRSLAQLEADGVKLVLTQGTAPGGDPRSGADEPFPWARLQAELGAVRAAINLDVASAVGSPPTS